LALTLALTSGNAFWATFMVSQYNLIMDFGLVVLPAWLLLWASPSFRRQFLSDFMPAAWHGRIYGTAHQLNTIIAQTVVVAAAKPQMQILSIPNMIN
jgi:hypothetical protein